MAADAVVLLRHLNRILDLDPLIDEIGFVHPMQLASLVESEGRSCSEDGNSKLYCKDHKLGISTDVVVVLYREAKLAFFAVMKNYETAKGSGREEIEKDVMKHSKALVLLSSDFGTAWNSRFC